MASTSTSAVSAFIEGAPPGELKDVIKDIKSLTSSSPDILSSAPVREAFKKYNEEQFTVVTLPGSSQKALITPYNSLSNGRYFDPLSSKSFGFDHRSQKVEGQVEGYQAESKHGELISTLQRSLQTYASEHYPPGSFTTGVFPSRNPSTSSPNEEQLMLIIVGNKYSPGNFWNGRWRSLYTLSLPSSSSSSPSLSTLIRLSVHYYEDGNVRLSTTHTLPSSPLSSSSLPSSSASLPNEIIKKIAKIEGDYQTEVNRGFRNLSEEVFKGLRRQLPVTRQKVEWEKVGGYRLGQDVGGGGRQR